MFASGVIFSNDEKLNGKELKEQTFKKLRVYAEYFCDIMNEYYMIV
jgi:hypothetical protein